MRTVLFGTLALIATGVSVAANAADFPEKRRCFLYRLTIGREPTWARISAEHGRAAI